MCEIHGEYAANWICECPKCLEDKWEKENVESN